MLQLVPYQPVPVGCVGSRIVACLLAAGSVLAAPAEATAGSASRELAEAVATTCYDNVGRFQDLPSLAHERGYDPLPPSAVMTLQATRAWVLPSRNATLILAQGEGAGCAVLARGVQVSDASAAVQKRLGLARAGQKAGPATGDFLVRRNGVSAKVRIDSPADQPGTLVIAFGANSFSARPAGENPLQSPSKPTAPVAPAAPRSPDRWDPAADSIENLAADIFDDVCYRTRSKAEAVKSKAETFKWTPLDKELTARNGFENGWRIRWPGPGAVLVFFDPLKPKCCTSAFPVQRGSVLAAVGTRYGLGNPEIRTADGKQVHDYGREGAFRMTLVIMVICADHGQHPARRGSCTRHRRIAGARSVPDTG